MIDHPLVATPCQVKVDSENYLSADKTGGLEILAQKGKIKVDNTLEARLEMISMQILPSMRNKLFGANPSRYWSRIKIMPSRFTSI